MALEDSGIQRAVPKAVQHAGAEKPTGCHTFRHSFAANLLEDGYDIRTIQGSSATPTCGRRRSTYTSS